MALLKVTAHLASPVAAYHPLHFDGLLASVAFDSEHHLTRLSPRSELADPRLPIVRISALGERCYLASAWVWPNGTTYGREQQTTRKDVLDIDLRQRPWNIKAGPEKARNFPIPTIEASECYWYVYGNRKGVKGLLRYVRQIGMLRRAGYGVVNGWDIERMDGVDALQLEPLIRENRSARNLPAAWAEGHIEPVAHEAPYWHPDRAGEPGVPYGVPCILRPEVVAAVHGVK